MKKLLLSLVVILLIDPAGYAQATTAMTIDGSNPKTVISRHIYGHFSEHLGRCIYDGFWVGDSITVPKKDRIRMDIVDALRKIKVPNLRWPGGCFADEYHWRDGIGPRKERPHMVNTNWGGVSEDNSFGTHEFLELCSLIGCEPYIAGNVGSGTIEEMAKWVEYLNSDAQSTMTELRKQNGRAEPWRVKFWGVGNESWGCGGNMTPEYYADTYRKYATFMTDWTNSHSLFRIASGANSSDYNWTEVLMKNIPHNMLEGVALHHYSVIDWNHKGDAVDFSEQQYFTTMQRAWFMHSLVQKHEAIMD